MGSTMMFFKSVRLPKFQPPKCFTYYPSPKYYYFITSHPPFLRFRWNTLTLDSFPENTPKKMNSPIVPRGHSQSLYYDRSNGLSKNISFNNLLYLSQIPKETHRSGNFFWWSKHNNLIVSIESCFCVRIRNYFRATAYCQ